LVRCNSGGAFLGASLTVVLKLSKRYPNPATGGGKKGNVTEPRMYQLIRHSGSIADRQFEIRFQEPGVAALISRSDEAGWFMAVLAESYTVV
jgi:hypothetical protein